MGGSRMGWIGSVEVELDEVELYNDDGFYYALADRVTFEVECHPIGWTVASLGIVGWKRDKTTGQIIKGLAFSKASNDKALAHIIANLTPGALETIEQCWLDIYDMLPADCRRGLEFDRTPRRVPA